MAPRYIRRPGYCVSDVNAIGTTDSSCRWTRVRSNLHQQGPTRPKLVSARWLSGSVSVDGDPTKDFITSAAVVVVVVVVSLTGRRRACRLITGDVDRRAAQGHLTFHLANDVVTSLRSTDAVHEKQIGLNRNKHLIAIHQWRIQEGGRPPYWLNASKKWWKFCTKMHHFCLKLKKILRKGKALSTDPTPTLSLPVFKFWIPRCNTPKHKSHLLSVDFYKSNSNLVTFISTRNHTKLIWMKIVKINLH